MGWAILASAALLGGVIAGATIWFWSHRDRRRIDASIIKAMHHLDTIIAASTERPDLPLEWAVAHAKTARMHLQDARREPLPFPRSDP